MNRYAELSLGILILAGCDSGTDPTSTATPDLLPSGNAIVVTLKGKDALASLDAIIARDGSAIFRSWNGRWIGTDCDTDLQFLPNRKLKMVEYGVGVNAYLGTYEVADDGKLKAILNEFGTEWPPMNLVGDKHSLLLQPPDGSSKFMMGKRGGAVISAGTGSYWPFRHISIQSSKPRFHD